MWRKCKFFCEDFWFIEKNWIILPYLLQERSRFLLKIPHYRGIYYLTVLRNTLISSRSSGESIDFFSEIRSIAQTISSFAACQTALLIAESCWIISFTPASSSIIWITQRICPSIRRRRSDTRFFWRESLIFIIQMEWVK